MLSPYTLCAHRSQKMFFRGRTWLWLCIRTGIILGSELNRPEQHEKNHCYQLNMFHCTFEDAENYCSIQGGQLAFTWNQEIQDLLLDFLKEGSKWWIGKNLVPLGKQRQGKNNTGKRLWGLVFMKETYFYSGTREGKNLSSFCFCIQKNQSLYFITIIPLKYLHFCGTAFALCNKNDEIFLSLSKVNLPTVSLKLLCKILKWETFYHFFPW